MNESERNIKLAVCRKHRSFAEQCKNDPDATEQERALAQLVVQLADRWENKLLAAKASDRS